MAAVTILKVERQQVIVVEGDPLAPNTVPASMSQGDTIYRQDTATHYSYTSAGVVLGTGAPSTHAHAGTDITSGVIAVARLGTGTPDISKVLRGDGTWSLEGGTPDAHVSTHHTGGSDVLVLSSIGGTITAGQHGTPTGDLHPTYALDADLATHEAAADPHAVYQKESEKGVANGYASLGATTLVPIAQLPVGSTSSTVTVGNDARLSDARTPTAHKTSHQDGGADELVVTGLAGLLADGQTALAHATSHKSGGSDAIKLDELAAPTDITTLNASTAQHGLLKKLDGLTSTFLRGDGAWAAPESGSAPSMARTFAMMGA